MARRTIEISRNPAHLAVRQGQLLIIPKEDKADQSANTTQRTLRPDLARLDSLKRRIPIEDIGLLIVDHAQTTYTHSALATLAQAGATIVVCGDDHLPAGILTPISSHTEQVWRVADQISCGAVLRKQLWQTIVRAKITAQASTVPADVPQRSRLLAMARRVRSGDTGNLEAQAARLYWQALFPATADWRFKRTPGSGQTDRMAECSPPNNLLDYGYAIVRAAVGRALVGAGLLPVIGIQHSNRSNAFCLADDLVEPLRPMIDRRAKRLFDAGRTVLDQSAKAELLLVLGAMVQTGEGESSTIGPLDVALGRYAASLALSYQTGRVDLLIPTESDGDPEDTARAGHA